MRRKSFRSCLPCHKNSCVLSLFVSTKTIILLISATHQEIDNAMKKKLPAGRKHLKAQ